MLRIRQTTLITSAAYADSTIQVAIPKSGSPIYQYIKSFLLFLITETARQIADNKENTLPKIKYADINLTSPLFYRTFL